MTTKYVKYAAVVCSFFLAAAAFFKYSDFFDGDSPGFDFFYIQCSVFNSDKILVFKGRGEMCAFRDDGSYLSSVFNKSKLALIAADDTVLWTIPAAVHHDIKFVDGGENFLAITSEFLTFRNEKVRADCFSKRRTLDGSILHQWCLRDHMKELEALGHQFPRWEIATPNRHPNDPSIWEISHANSIYPVGPNARAKDNPAFTPGNFIVTFYWQPLAVLILDQTMENILWSKDFIHFKTGGKIYSATVHDSQVTAAGNLLSYFNNMHIPSAKKVRGPPEPPRSRLAEFDPDTNDFLWQYMHPEFSSAILGSVERLENGNYLYSEANEGGKAFVITPSGEKTWAFRNPEQNGKGFPQPFGHIRTVSGKFLNARRLLD